MKHAKDGHEGFVVFDSERGVIEVQDNEVDAAHAAVRAAKKAGEHSIGADTRNRPVQGRAVLENPAPPVALAQQITHVPTLSRLEVMGRDEEASLVHAYETLKTYFPVQSGRGYAPYLAGSSQPRHIVRVKGLLKQNAKMEKASGKGEVPSVSFGLSLVPAMFGYDQKDSNGVSIFPQRAAWRKVNEFAKDLRPEHYWNLCPQSTRQCQRSCLVKTGQNDEVKNFSKLLMTYALQNHPAEFLRLLAYAIDKYFDEPAPKIAGKRRFVRLNVYSDVLWEKVEPWLFARYMPQFRKAGHAFYDYTKIENRIRGALPENYDLTFSYSGANLETCLEFLKKKRARCAVVFLRGKKEWKGLWKKRSTSWASPRSTAIVTTSAPTTPRASGRCSAGRRRRASCSRRPRSRAGRARPWT